VEPAELRRVIAPTKCDGVSKGEIGLQDHTVHLEQNLRLSLKLCCLVKVYSTEVSRLRRFVAVVLHIQ